MWRLITGGVLLVVALAPAAPRLKTAPAAENPLVGVWRISSVDGRRADGTSWVKTETFLADGTRIVRARVVGPAEELRSRYTIDREAQPARIDLVCDPAVPGAAPDRTEGIYKVNGDTLTICLATDLGKRPTEFASSRDASLTVYKRVKAKE